MQDEITKHTRKIYHTIKKPGHTTMEKIKRGGRRDLYHRLCRYAFDLAS